MLAFQVLFVYVPFMHALFGFSPLTGPQLLRIFGVGVGLMLIVMVEKQLRYRNGPHPRRPGSVSGTGVRPAEAA